jgi:hypothetical protein
MSLEQSIQENTAAVLKLCEVWAALTAKGQAIEKAGTADKGLAAGGTVVKPGKDAAAAGSKSGASTASSSKEKESPEKIVEDKPALEYATVSKAIVSLAAKHGRPAALAVLEPFGVTSGKDLKPEQWAEALAAAETALEAEAEVA